MSEAITIYYGFTPNKRAYERGKSLASIDALEEAGYAVTRHPCYSLTDYAEGLRSVWHNPGDLVIIEHDMVVPVERLEELRFCSHPICAHTYWIALGVAGRRPMLSASVKPMGSDHNPRVNDGDQSSFYSGIGCCKMNSATRRAMPLPSVVPWSDLEVEVNKAIDVAGPWHLHWPVLEHIHGFMEKRQWTT